MHFTPFPVPSISSFLLAPPLCKICFSSPLSLNGPLFCVVQEMFYHQGALVATKRREEVEAARKTSAKSAEAVKSGVLDQAARLFMAGQPNPPYKVLIKTY